MRWKNWGSVIISVNRAERDEVEKMEVYESICEQAQKDEMEKMEVCDSICEQATEE